MSSAQPWRDEINQPSGFPTAVSTCMGALHGLSRWWKSPCIGCEFFYGSRLRGADRDAARHAELTKISGMAEEAARCLCLDA